MNQFKSGTVVFHKATHARCVVLSNNSIDGTVIVRDNKNEELAYLFQELVSEKDIKSKRNKAVKKFLY